MPRIRTVKPDFWKSEALSELPPETHMLACALLNYSDDEGYFNANPRLVAAECCPLRELSVSVPDSLNHLVKIGYIRLGIGEDGKAYGHIINFLEHQFINRPSESKISVLEIVWDVTSTAHGILTEPSMLERKGKERKGKEQSKKEFDLAFADFWSLYLKKVGKGQAEKAFKSSLKITSLNQIMEGLARYNEANATTEQKYIKHPATWLNGKCWLDEYETAPQMLSAKEQKDLMTRKMAEKGLN
ncbi:MAG: hypothetical protein KAS66_05175 [Candidatus Omnitrophica bacterium]|nr:hypothetical protein [Candidatus Omnitrophota bacterium]